MPVRVTLSRSGKGCLSGANPSRSCIRPNQPAGYSCLRPHRRWHPERGTTASTWRALGGLKGDDALSTHCVGYGHGPKRTKAAVGIDLEFVEDPFASGLHIEELAAGGSRGVNRARVGG